MKRLVMITVVTLVLSGFCVSLCKAQDSIEGDWVGGSNLFGNPVFVSFTFSTSAEGPRGSTNVQSWRVSNRSLTDVQLEGTRLHFEFPSMIGIPYVGDGEIKAGIIEGTIRRGEQHGRFHLIRVAKIDRNLYDRYVGDLTASNWSQLKRAPPCARQAYLKGLRSMITSENATVVLQEVRVLVDAVFVECARHFNVEVREPF